MSNRIFGAARIAVCLMVSAGGASAQLDQEPPEFVGPKPGDTQVTSGRADRTDAERILEPNAAPPVLDRKDRSGTSQIPVGDGSGTPEGPLPPIHTTPRLGDASRNLGVSERRAPSSVGPTLTPGIPTPGALPKPGAGPSADGAPSAGGPLAPSSPRRLLQPSATDLRPGHLPRQSPLSGKAGALDRRTPQIHDRVAYWDMTGKAGLDLLHAGSDLPVSAGAAWLDYDADGDPDLFLSQTSGASKLYRNEADGTFVDVTDIAGVGAPLDETIGATAADFDGDGRVDLYLLNRGENRLFRNLGDGTFADETAAAGVAGSGAYSTSAAWADYDQDGDLDLYVTNAFAASPESAALECHPNELFRNEGDGTFTEVAQLLGVAGQGCAFGVVFADLDGDLDPDLLLGHQGALAGELTRLYRNDGGMFQEQPFTNQIPRLLQSIGLAAGDIDNDGTLDALLAGHGANVLGLNLGGIFHDVAAAYAVDRPARAALASGQGAAFFDYDNDGTLDLLIADGADPEATRLHLYRNRDGAGFEDVTSQEGLLAIRGAQTIAPADFDLDGDIDILLGQPGAGYTLMVNVEGNAHGYLAVRAESRDGAAPAIGAKIQLIQEGGQVQTRLLGSEATLASAPDPSAHFGLEGDSQVQEVIVEFPSGVQYALRDVSAGQRLTIRDPKLTIESSDTKIFSAAGQLVHYTLTFTNRSGNLALAAESWIDVRRKEAQQDHSFIPATRIGTLLPESSLQLDVTLLVPPATPKGHYLLTHRIGQRGNGLAVHQAYVEIVIE
ncbi:MAG: FG-GAP-like repeat-containing protein [Planctomycetota bacterium]